MIKNLFTTPIYQVKIDNKILHDRFIEVYDDLEAKGKFKYRADWMSHKLSDGDFQENLINIYQLDEFKKVIDEHLGHYLAGLEYHRPSWWKIVECWMTAYDKGDFAHLHTHMPSDISGVYYVRTSGNDGRIFFMNPNQMVNTPMYRHIGDRTFIEPEDGMLILFPAWLNHGVEPNRTDDRRLSVAFNVNFWRDY